MYAVFDVQIGRHPIEYLTIELFQKDLPKTCANFAAFCTENPLTYQGTKFFKIVKNFMAQGGDVVNNDGRGVISMYGPTFKDESFKYKHDSRGLLSMVNTGPNTNGCQFLITFMPCPWLDRKNVVFGKVVDGLKVIDGLEAISSDNGVPKALARILHCGLVKPLPPSPALELYKEPKKPQKPSEQHEESKDQGSKDRSTVRQAEVEDDQNKNQRADREEDGDNAKTNKQGQEPDDISEKEHENKNKNKGGARGSQQVNQQVQEQDNVKKGEQVGQQGNDAVQPTKKK